MMMNYPKFFLFSIIILGVLIFSETFGLYAQKKVEKDEFPSKLKTSLNAYSFNIPLSDGSMDLDELLEYSAEKGFDGVDITAYYFPGYPEVPSDEYLYHIKKKAFLLGLEISGTGVRNDFTNPDEIQRRESVDLVKNWIVAAEKLGAPVIRIFSGISNTDGYSREEVFDWLIEDVKECVEFGKKHGVVVAIQNHHDFIANADDTIEIMERIDSDWFGLILDIGSFWEGDSYKQIEQTAQYAVSWQLKDGIYINGKQEATNLERIINIIKESGYRGYIPLETLGDGNPAQKVNKFFEEIQKTLKKLDKE